MRYYAVESSNHGSDGDNHSILLYTKQSDWSFTCVQEVNVCDNNRARRPHRLLYDAVFTKAFIVNLTKCAHISKSTVDADGTVHRVFCVSLPFMKGAYARSIYVHTDGLMYITAGPKGIWAVDHKNPNGITPVKFHSVAGLRMKVMNDLLFYKGWWYATSTRPCAIRRFRSLATMADNEDVSGMLGLCKEHHGKSSGTPYFLQVIDNRMYVPYIFTKSGVVSFEVPEDNTGSPGGGIKGATASVRHHWKTGGWEEHEEDIAIRNLGW